jgi:hypothetical protein
MREFIIRIRKWVPLCFYNRNENRPKSPFFKGGLSKAFRPVPPFEKGGEGGISSSIQVNQRNLLDAPLENAGAPV